MTKTTVMGIRLTDAERAVISETAEAVGMKPTAWARAKLLDQPITIDGPTSATAQRPKVSKPSSTFQRDPADCPHKYRSAAGRCVACGTDRKSTKEKP